MNVLNKMDIGMIFLQGGALVAVCLIAYYLCRDVTQTNKEVHKAIVTLVTNHLEHNNATLQEVSETSREVAETNRAVAEAVNRLCNGNPNRMTWFR